jgi:outer membrane protein OmpA-like peptidoglycan-associated protein
MKYFQFVILLLLIFFSNTILFGQQDYPDCDFPKKIELTSIIKTTSLDEIYYQPEDKYTYWYEISSQEKETLSYEMSAVNPNDVYEILSYKKKGINFCNELINNKLKPFSNAVKGQIELDKGDVYYLNIIFLSGNGCGHHLSLKTTLGSLKIKAINNDCVEALIEEIVVAESAHIKALLAPKIASVAVELATVNPIAHEDSMKSTLEIPEQEIKRNIKCLVINTKTKNNVEAFVSVKSLNSDYEKQFVSLIDSGFFMGNYMDSVLLVSVKKLGYKTFNGLVNIDSNQIKIELNPIKVGDKLVMRKVYFHPNTYVLKDESKDELNKLLSFILENKQNVFEIQGHTNGNRMIKKNKRYAHLGENWNFKGSSKKLSKLRAEDIKKYLMKNGVAEIQLQTSGYGGDKMAIAKPKSLSQAMKNIRVEVIVLQ